MPLHPSATKIFFFSFFLPLLLWVLQRQKQEENGERKERERFVSDCISSGFKKRLHHREVEDEGGGRDHPLCSTIPISPLLSAAARIACMPRIERESQVSEDGKWKKEPPKSGGKRGRLKKTQSKVWRHMATPLEMDSIVLSQTRGRKNMLFQSNLPPPSVSRTKRELRSRQTKKQSSCVMRVFERGRFPNDRKPGFSGGP